MSSLFSAVVMGGESLLVECCSQLLERGHRIAAVVSDDMRIREWATEHRLPLVAPGPDLAARLPAEFDFFLSIANLSMVPSAVLERAKRGGINFHDGPLPRHAGLNAPVWALLAGEEGHGVCFHCMTGSADEGNVLVSRAFPIQVSDTALTLNARCYELGVDSFGELVRLLEAGTPAGTPQDLTARTYHAKADRPTALGLIDPSASAAAGDRIVRALHFGPYRNPLALPKLVHQGRALHPSASSVLPESSTEAPGTVVAIDDSGISIATREGVLLLSQFVSSEGAAVGCIDAAKALELSVGTKLDAGATSRDALSALGTELGAHEDFWRRRLSRYEGVSIPLPRTGKAGEGASRVSLSGVAGSFEEWVAAFALYVGRVLGRDTLALGWVDRSLDFAGWDALFARQVPLELELVGAQGFGALAERATKELSSLARRKSYPLDLVARNPGQVAPVFELGIEVGPGSADLRGRTLCLVRDDEGVALVYDGAAYDTATAEAIAAQVSSLREAGLAEPERPVSRLPVVSARERKLLLEEFNATATPLPPDAIVHRAIAAQAERTPDAAAVVFEGRSLTYGELERKANRLAHRLAAFASTPDTPIGVFLPRSEDLVVAVLGVLKAGLAYLPLDPSYPQDRLTLMLEDSGARAAVTTRAEAGRLPSGVEAIPIDDESAFAGFPDQAPATSVKPDSLAYVIYTSGSTGRPKGVMVEHRNVTNFFVGMDARIPRGEEASWLAVTSLSFDISVLELLWTLSRGVKVVLSSESRVVSSGSPEEALGLDFSLFYFASDEGPPGPDKYRLLLEGARFADENGFLAVWTPERHFAAFGGIYPNPAVAGAALAVLTKNVRIRAGSSVIPLHHPIRVAEEWALVDNLSNGRVDISFASGWHPDDFVLRPENFAKNKEVMLRDIDVVRRLWRGERLPFSGPKGEVTIGTLPRPVQPELPIWLTAAGNVETFEAAGRIGAGLLTHLLGQTLEEVRDKVHAYRRAWREAGHPGRGHVTLMLHTFVGDDDADVKATVREPMKGYLKSSIMLIAQHAWTFPAFKRVAKKGASFNDNFNSLAPGDMDELLDYSFERYFETAGLFGTEARCLRILSSVKSAGVDEIACLLDFGIETDRVMAQLPKLAALRRKASARPRLSEDDFSVAAQLVRHGVTHLQCTPSMARMMLGNDRAREALDGLECWMIGGEALADSLVADARSATSARLLNMYGPTETTVWSTTDAVTRSATLGKPIANTTIRVLDRQGELLPIGVPGELCIGGEGVTRGYLGRPELTAERFIPDPFAGEPGARLYRTGDLARFLADGRLEFLGRLDHQVKVRGYRIELGEIEASLAAIEGVREVVVTVREDTPGDVRLVAYLVPRAGVTLREPELRDKLLTRLPDYMVPAHFVVMQSFPLTPNAKVDRKALPPPHLTRSREDAAFVQLENDVEQTIAKVWQDVLGVDKVGAGDNFFELGGHSLLAVRAHRALREALGADLSITDIFRFPTVRGLGDHLSSAAGGSTGSDEHRTRAANRREALARRAEMRGNRRG